MLTCTFLLVVLQVVRCVSVLIQRTLARLGHELLQLVDVLLLLLPLSLLPVLVITLL